MASLASTALVVLDCITLENGQQIPLSSIDDLPYRLLENLGAGASATVEMVQDVVTSKVYARKVFRNVHARNLEQVQEQYRNEVDIIRRLKRHHHIIRVHASYICGRDLGVVLEPVADGGDLAHFLQRIRDANRLPSLGESEILTKAFGCLAVGLEFMHSQEVRHKDIKPQNILIHESRVVYTDFGISYDSSLQSASTTTGQPDAFTRRYCAPEVADWAPRNRKSDVFSLGCVFLEMLQVFGLLSKDIMDGVFHEHIGLIQDSLRLLSSPFRSEQFGDLETRIQPAVQHIAEMLRANPEERTSARNVVFAFRNSGILKFFFCPSCSEFREEPVRPRTTIDETANSFSRAQAHTPFESRSHLLTIPSND
jgi:serine/threonine protein kinase